MSTFGNVFDILSFPKQPSQTSSAMYLTLDITHIDSKVQRKFRFLGLFNFFQSLLNRLVSSLIQSIDEVIVTLDGYIMHLDDVPQGELSKLQQNVTRLGQRIARLDDHLYSLNYFENDDLRKKMRYLVKQVYRMEAKIHKKIHADTSCVSDCDLSNLVSYNSKRNVSITLKNEIS